MTHRISAAERATFKGCRRRWDFSSSNRMNLEPVAGPPEISVERAVKDALAIYYFPGMWDWPRAVVLPLVTKGFERSMLDQRNRSSSGDPLSPEEEQRWRKGLIDGRRLLDEYVTWAPSADRFGPVLVESEFVAPVASPHSDTDGLVTESGDAVHYHGRIDALVVDQFDAYWILRHRVVDRWTPIEQLRLDEESIAACWAWENFYLGMTITGTIDNEVRFASENGGLIPGGSQVGESDPEFQPPPATGRVAQHAASGGGRSVPQHRRLSARSREPDSAPRVEEHFGPGFRRAWIRRRRSETAAAVIRLSHEATLMIEPTVMAYPNPSPEQCQRCRFVQPCLTMNDGSDPAPILADHYHQVPAAPEGEHRLGSATWSIGRGAAPPQFGPKGQ
ncbi:MAG TPA: hypothetical protein VHU85_11210 [Acidimicrobiales bacterium]|nr:hypothetical protein [Acidimicrobiales bacterium]